MSNKDNDKVPVKHLSLLVLIITIMTGLSSFVGSYTTNNKKTSISIRDDDTTWVRLDVEYQNLHDKVSSMDRSIGKITDEIVDIRIFMGKINEHIKIAEARKDSGFSLFCQKTRETKCGPVARRE